MLCLKNVQYPIFTLRTKKQILQHFKIISYPYFKSIIEIKLKLNCKRGQFLSL